MKDLLSAYVSRKRSLLARTEPRQTKDRDTTKDIVKAIMAKRGSKDQEPLEETDLDWASEENQSEPGIDERQNRVRSALEKIRL